MSYQTQKLAVPLVLVAVALFFLQLIFGAITGLYYVSENVLSGVINFNLARAYHLNALVFWLVAATLAAVIYVLPIVSGREIASPGLLKLAIALITVGVVGGFLTLPLMQSGKNIWLFGQPLLYEGKEFMELGRLWDVLILAGLFIYAIVALKTLPPMREWPLALWALIFGAAVVFILYLPGNWLFKAWPTNEYFRWWTVHYWVEGALEVAYVGAFGLVLMLLIPVEEMKRVVDKYVFYDVVLAATSGILGQGHHYFWVGTPDFWIMVGGVFSVLEILPLLLLAFEALKIAKAAKIKFENIPSMYFMVGILLFGFVGVSLHGLIITWPWTNWWEHGTWITMLHAHECMMAFGMGAISLLLLITPGLTGKPVDKAYTVWGKRSFHLMATGQIIMATSFGLAGLPQVYSYSILGAPWETVWEARQYFMPFVLLGGALVFLGFLYYAAAILRHFFFPVHGEPYKVEQEPPTFMNTLRGMPALITLSVLLAFIGTAGIWSYSSTTVLEGHNPILPYMLASIAFVGLAALLWIMLRKFTKALELGYYEV